MRKGRGGAIVILAVAILVGSVAGAAAQHVQPSYDTLRLAHDGAVVPYAVWDLWSPLIVTTPDGGAWAFFSAEPGADVHVAQRGHLYAARFDPEADVWLPARALPGGDVQFGPAAVVDDEGVVHLAYTDWDTDAEPYGRLVYTRTDERGGWIEPVPIAPHPDAGHQFNPSLALDRRGNLHVAWQDQRHVPEEARAVSPAYADIFVSDRAEDGTWSAPVQINQRTNWETSAFWPQLVADGDRLIAVWSVYTMDKPLDTASGVVWSVRSGEEPRRWAEPRVLLEGGHGKMGLQLLELAPDPVGGAALVYGHRTRERTALFLRRLAPDAAEWEPAIPLVAGDGIGYPTLAIAADGTAYVAFQAPDEAAIRVAGLAIAPGAGRPGPPVVLTPGEAGHQTRPAIAAGNDGPSVLYIHQTPEGRADEVRALRAAWLPIVEDD